jgi:predicted secreted Zn-dependent protease
MGLRLLPLLAFVLFGAACASGARAQRDASSPPAGQVVVLEDRSEQGARVRLNETVTKRLYVVEGSTASEIRSHLLSEGPAAAGDGKHYDGLASWAAHWTFRYDRGPSECALANATLDASIEIRLPQLVDEGAVAPDLLPRWQAYIAALEAHEMGHVDRETAVLEGLRDAFERVEPASDCTALGNALNALGEEYLAQVRLTDAAYDLETDHGLTQGAVFP